MLRAMAEGRSGLRDLAGQSHYTRRRRRGFMMLEVKLPRYVVPKVLLNGKTAFYWNLPKKYRDLGCKVAAEHETALGTDYEVACGKDGKGGKAATLNGLFDEWNAKRLGKKSRRVARRVGHLADIWPLLSCFEAPE